MVATLRKCKAVFASCIGERTDRERILRRRLKEVAVQIAVAALLVGCAGGNDNEAQGGNQPSEPLTPKGWELVWSDEFDGTSLDANKWNMQTGDGTAEGIPGWGNNELQTYQANNVSVAGGDLIITALAEQVGDHAYTSGRINTSGKFDFTHGRVVASIQAPGGKGMWSAFWMLPTESEYGTWAAGGEIDIMEVFSRDPEPFNQAALHYGMAWPLNDLNYKRYTDFDPSDGFHTYVVEWDQNEIRWFVDGTHYHTVRNFTYWNYYVDETTNAHTRGGDAAPFDRPFHLLLNLAVGGNLPGDPVPESFPSELRVDYVRVYECNINLDTGVGCDGFEDLTDPGVTPPIPDDVYRVVYDLYVDSVGPLTFPESEDAVALDIGVYDANGALTLAEVDVEDRGRVIEIKSTGGGNFSFFPASLERQRLFGMGDASDSANYAGELQFDLFVFEEETDQESGIQVKLDSGFPDLGFVELPISSLQQDEWQTVTVQISDIAHNAGDFGGGPVDLAEVLSLFVLEPTSSARLRVDNVRLICGHVNEGDCGIAPPGAAPPAAEDPQPVYIDAVDPLWDAGIAGSDSGSGWANYTENDNPANKVQWREIQDEDPKRNQILEVTFAAGEAFGVWFIQAAMGVDLSAFAPGSVSFDIKVDDYSGHDAGMTMKIDCIFPCTSGDQGIGKVGDGAWETVEIPVAQLLGGGLNLSTVNTGIVVFPTEQTNALTFRIDNIQWLPGEGPVGTSVVELYGDSLGEGWSLWDCCGGATFDEVDDDEEHGRVVELAFGATGTVTGFQATDSVDVSGLTDGTLEFEFKQVSPPPEGSQWRLKLESANATTAVEVLLTHEENPDPSSDWQQYSYSLTEDLAGLDFANLKLVVIFPDWANADGAVGRLDNVRFVPNRDSIELYTNELAEGWFLWDCCGSGSFREVDDDEEHGRAIELSFGAGGTVTGLQATAAVDASDLAQGTLEFEFKQVAPPPEGSQWRLKLESDGAATAVEVLLTAGGNMEPNEHWQPYSFAFDDELADLDLGALKLVLIFPDWGNAEGGVGRIDNIRLVQSL